MIWNDYGSPVSFETPEMDLKFTGVPNKQSVSIYPTKTCLIALDDTIPFVLSTDDIQIAHFERIEVCSFLHFCVLMNI